MIEDLVTEQINTKTKTIDRISTLEILKLINEEDKKVAFVVEKELKNISLTVETIVKALLVGGRLIYIGAGTSGRLAILDAAECPPTFGTSPDLVIGLIAGGEKALTQAVEGIEDDTLESVRQLKSIGLNEKDVLVGIAASGRTPYVLSAMEYAKSVQCLTVAISCTTNSKLYQLADIAITPVVGPEVISGSTRLKAGTAQKMVLNMISTAAMIRLGKVYQNLMVDVQPTNKKLIERAKKIVMRVTGVDYKKAEQVLEEAHYSTKAAIVMIKTNQNRDEAVKLLAKSNGFIHKALLLNQLVYKEKGGEI
jgi:N-acetylmuramic acid 6-phosphate etherase